jgi:succinate-acetate transporter protein
LLVFVAGGIARVVGPNHGTFAWTAFIIFWLCFAAILALQIYDFIRRRRTMP